MMTPLLLPSFGNEITYHFIILDFFRGWLNQGFKLQATIQVDATGIKIALYCNGGSFGNPKYHGKLRLQQLILHNITCVTAATHLFIFNLSTNKKLKY